MQGDPPRLALRCRVVLVGPRGGRNVGAVCRAMKNMGTADLVTVGACFDQEEARRMAVHAGDVLERSRDVSSVAEAIAGCGLVVGTTGRVGAFRDRSDDVADVAQAIVARALDPTERPPALVFGPEDTGLTNRDVALCHRLATIPADAAYSSLNLAQAVLVCLYEIRRQMVPRMAPLSHPSATVPRPLADAAAVEAMLQALEGALLAIGFLGEEGSEQVMATVRALLARSGLDEREVRILRGISRQIGWFAEGGSEVARAKRARGEKMR